MENAEAAGIPVERVHPYKRQSVLYHVHCAIKGPEALDLGKLASRYWSARAVLLIVTHFKRSIMTKVVLRSGESQEQLLRRFRKQVIRDRILSDVKKKRFFVSNSQKRRLALRKAQRRERKRKWRLERRRRY
jgi:small subunit ribosomal protein S21